jgi:hypothetical protein
MNVGPLFCGVIVDETYHIVPCNGHAMDFSQECLTCITGADYQEPSQWSALYRSKLLVVESDGHAKTCQQQDGHEKVCDKHTLSDACQ